VLILASHGQSAAGKGARSEAPFALDVDVYHV
jgi:hypothetical protein